MNPIVRGNGGQMRELSAGERIAGCGGPVATLTTVGTDAMTGAMIAAGFLRRTGPTGAYADTFPTADAILQAIGGGLNYPSNLPAVEQAQVGYGGAASVGAAFRFVFINGVAYDNTVAAPMNGGITLAGTTLVSASTVREFLVEIVNATPPQTFIASALTTQKVFTGLSAAQTALLTPGMRVYGTDVGALARIVSVQQGVGFTVDVNTSGAITNGSITITPEVLITGIAGFDA